MSDKIFYPAFGATGTKVLSERLAVIEGRAEGRLMAPHELAEKRVLERSLAELAALGRAFARCDGASLDLVRLQMDELDAAGLTYDCLNPDDILEIRAQA